VRSLPSGSTITKNPEESRIFDAAMQAETILQLYRRSLFPRFARGVSLSFGFAEVVQDVE
jgi:hypothetical protein